MIFNQSVEFLTCANTSYFHSFFPFLSLSLSPSFSDARQMLQSWFIWSGADLLGHNVLSMAIDLVEWWSSGEGRSIDGRNDYGLLLIHQPPPNKKDSFWIKPILLASYIIPVAILSSFFLNFTYSSVDLGQIGKRKIKEEEILNFYSFSLMKF